MSENAEKVLFDPSVGKSNLRDHIPKESLLAVIQEHPDFSGWKRSGQYFRDPNDSARTLGLNGVKSFKGGTPQTLFDVAKERGLIDEARKHAGLPDFSQKGNSTRKRKSTGHNPPADNPNVDTQPDDPLSKSASPTVHSQSKQTKPKSSTTPQAQALWKKPESDKAKTAVQKYLTDSALVTENYEDLFGSYMRCVIDNTTSGKGSPALVVPMLTPEQASRVAIGAPTSADKVARVLLPESAEPEKKQLGSPDDGIGRISYLPTRTENCESLKYLVCEGFRDALSIRTHYPDHHIFVCQSKGNLQHVPGFLPEGANVLIISDHDGHDDPNQNGETDAAKLRQELLRRGYSCQALMPPEPKKDANDALRDGKLDQWLKELVEVPTDLAFQDPNFDVEAVVGDVLPTLQRGILSIDIEQYLELAAESLDLNYESAFCELLCNVGFAIGGHKTVVIKNNWQEKALLWLASIGASGIGKTPLNRMCGGQQLEEQQRQWQEHYKLELDQWEDQEKPKSKKPIRKRWIATALTMERLCALHEDNPAGIGLLSDEILSVLDGLNQYKGKGNDRQKLLMLWNGHSFDNPTSENDRYIPSVFVPVSGGIQDSLLRKIISDENKSDGLVARFLFNHLFLSKELASIERQQEIDELMSVSNGKVMLSSLFNKLVKIRDQKCSVQMNQHAKNHLQLYVHHLKSEARRGSEQTFAAYNKLRTYVYRVALTLHYLSERDPDAAELSEQTALNAIIVMKFFVASMKRAYQTAALNRTEESARRVLDKVRRSGGRATERAIKQDLRRTIGDNVENILKALEDTGRLVKTKEGRAFNYSIP